MTAAVVSAVVAAAVAAMLVRWLLLRRYGRELVTLADSVQRLRRGEPGTAGGALTAPVFEELAVLAADLDRRERSRKQSEDVLRLVIEAAPSAMVFMRASGQILLANAQARTLFFDGADLVGKNFLGMLARAPEALKRAVTGEGDELLSREDADGEPRTFHLAKRHLALDGERAVLVTVNDLTRELGRREIEVWKQVIRVIAHEVGNSLAPISTLASAGRVLAQGTPAEAKLHRAFDTIQERAVHLRDFLDGYARFARLPRPTPSDVCLRELAHRMETLWPGIELAGDLDGAPGWFDAPQIEQLLLNLLKNAGEAESPRGETVLAIEARSPRFVRFTVKDRGHGMAPEVMKRALVPLFSTKANGAGLGLALCREIAEAHGGTLRLEAREGGGLEVSVKLPRRPVDDTDAPSPLTLTRGP